MTNEQGSEQSPPRNDLMERLRSLESSQTSGTLAELAYRRAREALEKALEEARSIRLQALENARSTREREMCALMESLRSMRGSAESEIQGIIAAAEAEAARIRVRAETDAEETLREANRQSAAVRAEAAAIRKQAEERLSQVERLESDFNALAADVAKRLGISEPSRGWLSRIYRRRE